jgi:hypothetical protein
MAPNALLGMRSTADYANNVVQWDWADTVLAYDMYGELPLTALMSRAKTTPVDSFRKHWFDEDYDARVLVLNALAAASTSGVVQNITVSQGAFYAPATMILHSPVTGEHLRVTTDPTNATVISVYRGFGLAFGTPVAAIPNGSPLTLVGTAAEEGSNIPTPVNTNPFELVNYTQIFKTPYTITGTDKATEHRNGDPWVEASAKAAIRHHKDIEFASFFGVRSNGQGTGGKPLHTMGGLDFFIKSNRQDFGGTGTLEQLEDFTTEVARFGNRDIFTMCGDQFITALNRLIRGQTNYTVQAPFKLWGYDVNTLVIPNGVTLRCITHPMLNGHSHYRNSAWMLHMPDLMRHPLRGRDTQVMPDVLANGTDGEGECLQTEMTLSLRREKNFGILLNL